MLFENLKPLNRIKYIASFLIIGAIFLCFTAFTPKKRPFYFSPTSMVLDKSTHTLFVAGKTANKVVAIKNGNKKFELTTPLPPKGVTLSKENLLVACSFSEGELLVASTNDLKLQQQIPVGKGACDVVADQTGSNAFVANQYSNSVSFVDLKKGEATDEIEVLRQPMCLTLSADEKYLYVANFLTAQRADLDTVTSAVSIIDIQQKKVIKHIDLANGSNALRGICASPDGKYVFISHNLGRFQVPTTQLEQGWMNTSAISVIDAQQQQYVATILLDEPENGAAGSWGVKCTDKHLLVAHSGTHDVSKIDYPAFVKRLQETINKEELSYDLRFLSGIRERVSVLGNGPRAIEINQNTLYAASYFSDTINVIDLENSAKSKIKAIALNPELKLDSIRLGEIYFHDATYCFQKWQACTGCHPNDARTDGLNWDLLNDGMGNPKNCKSMLLSHATPPAMISGIRASAEVAVRAGFKYIQFVQIDEGHAKAVDHYLKSLKPVPSPYLQKGKLSAKAEKGKKIFESMRCGQCHSGPYFTDGNKHEIGTPGQYDVIKKWDTPTLIEVWRTGPYLHDGRSATLKEIFTTEKHGIWKDLTDEELDQLTEYVLSL
jgi:DNA-binding beta-propeller fold protein YncE/cytochrome c551/c552